jgi:hypothetical protein
MIVLWLIVAALIALSLWVKYGPTKRSINMIKSRIISEKQSIHNTSVMQRLTTNISNREAIHDNDLISSIDQYERVNDELKVPIQLRVPMLAKEHDHNFVYHSDKDGSNHIVNPFRMMCSCEIYNSKHHYYQICDIRRLCKHLIRIYRDIVNTDDLDKFKIAILNSGHGVKSNFMFLADQEVENSSESVLLIYDKDDPWWDVFTEDENHDLQRYGFNILMNRWSYNAPPTKNESDITRALNNILKSTSLNMSEDFQKIKDIVSKVNNTTQLGNLEKRLGRAEERYAHPNSTKANDKKYDLLCKAYDIAREKVHILQDL